MSQLTTHILDTSKGRPAEGIEISLFQQHGKDWEQIAKAVTNADGRVADLLKNEEVLSAGVYKMHFDIQSYFNAQSLKSFYPFVEIVFFIEGAEHYHIPLLLSPFGYSTYRGS
jgi:5-hydroxyisourate hydrolase